MPTTQTKFLTTLFVALTLLVIVVGASLVTQFATDQARDRVRHALNIERAARDIEISLLEAAARAKPGIQGDLGTVNGKLTALDQLVSPQNDDHEMVANLLSSVREHLREVEADKASLLTGPLGTALPGRVAELIEEEMADVDRRRAKVGGLYTATAILRGFGVVGLIVVIVSIYRQVLPVIRQLTKVNDRLTAADEHNQELIRNLREKNDDLDHFAYIASHDLQEPLRTVSNFVDVFEEEYADRLDEQASVYFGFIHRATDRMRLLINNLLDYSQIGQREERAVVDLNQIVGEIRESLALKLRESGARLTVQPLPTVSGYPSALLQLLQNLITNALKFAKPEEPPVIDVYATQTDTYHRIAVQDQGVGISEADQDRIFRMFARTGPAKTSPGQGIGLAFCRKIVELHGGSLRVESIPGRGSTFYFTLPRAQQDEKTQ